ncbi:hypothetical protein RZS08_37570, partial [Arthrospira platensis SPKY1]|nr:hypothetical protein [Arthrospira platensis SPKY1]
ALEFSTTLQMDIRNKEVAGKDDHSLDALEYNEHAFRITKNKMNAGLRTGEFKLRRTADEKTGLVEGDVDEFETVLAYAKKFSIYTGGGSAWKIEFGEYESPKFKNAAQALELL